MLNWLSAGIERRYKTVMVFAVAFLLVGGASAADVGQHLGVGGFYAPGDESTRADAAFDDLPAGPHNLVVVARSKDPGGVDSAEAGAAGIALTSFLRGQDGISSTVSYWPAENPALRSRDGTTALVLARIDGGEDQRKDTLERIFPRIHGDHDGLSLTLGGQPAVEREVTTKSEHDLHRLELMATPVVALILLFVFGSVVASLLPLVIGLTAIIGTLMTLRTVSLFTEVSMYSLNIATALSLGLAIDYGLFIVTRYREELDTGVSVPAAVRTALSTAGRTVLFSALTVALSLSSLLVFPLYYLRSFAYAGIAVVGFAAASAVVVLPAVLLLLGRHIDRWDVIKVLASLGDRGIGQHRLRRAVSGGRLSRAGTGRWHDLALFVMRRPIPLIATAVTLLVVVGLPFLGARYALPDVSNLPKDGESARVTRLLEREWPGLSTDAMYIVAPGQRLSGPETRAYAEAVSAVDGVTQVRSSAGVFAGGTQVAPASPETIAAFDGGDASWLSVGMDGDPQGEGASRVVADIRSLDSPADVLVGGVAAHLVDTKHTLAQQLPLALGIVAGSTIVLLFLFTGSVLIPVKAVLLNLLSLTATFGAAVWIFQDGHLRWLLGDFQTNGAIELTTPILLFAVAFGLSMDYELFLLSRIKEEYGRLGDNTAAVASGLEKTGRLVTFAALLFVVVMAAFATSELSVLKLVGVGLGLAVLMDATIIRAILVPAVMRLAGPLNWWAPPLLRAVHQRIGLHEGPAPERLAPDPHALAPAMHVGPAPRRQAVQPRHAQRRLHPDSSAQPGTSAQTERPAVRPASLPL
jgi:putative drug exporter of the RND superfamily